MLWQLSILLLDKLCQKNICFLAIGWIRRSIPHVNTLIWSNSIELWNSESGSDQWKYNLTASMCKVQQSLSSHPRHVMASLRYPRGTGCVGPALWVSSPNVCSAPREGGPSSPPAVEPSGSTSAVPYGSLRWDPRENTRSKHTLMELHLWQSVSNQHKIYDFTFMHVYHRRGQTWSFLSKGQWEHQQLIV